MMYFVYFFDGINNNLNLVIYSLIECLQTALRAEDSPK